jgi:nitrate/nitrite-specific signal transduction histidine kinase
VAQRGQPSYDDVLAIVDQLREQLGALRAGAEKREQRLASEVKGLEADTRDLQQMLQASERQAGQLSNLYVATYQLHASLELHDVKQAICDIAINLLGAAEYALLIRDDEQAIFEVAAASDPRPAAYAGGHYAGGDAAVDAALADGVTRFTPSRSLAVAVVPFAVHGAVIGALVINGLLPQRSALGADDRELLDVLAAHAASALLAARLFHERTRKLRTLEGLMELLKPPREQQ